MRKLSDLILLVVGVLYPFIVYFGMDHVSTPLFGLILGALWLVRAPALKKVIVADGFHRICAAYRIDPDVILHCKLAGA